MTDQLILDIFDLDNPGDIVRLKRKVKENISDYLPDDEEEIFKFLEKMYSIKYESTNFWKRIPEKYRKDRNFALKCLSFKKIPYMEEYKDDYEIGFKMYKDNVHELTKSKLIKDEKFISKFIFETEFNKDQRHYYLDFIEKLDQKNQKIIIKNLNVNLLGYLFDIPQTLKDNRRYCFLLCKHEYRNIKKTDYSEDEDFIIELMDSIFKDWEGKCTPYIFNYCLLNEKIEKYYLENSVFENDYDKEKTIQILEEIKKGK